MNIEYEHNEVFDKTVQTIIDTQKINVKYGVYDCSLLLCENCPFDFYWGCLESCMEMANTYMAEKEYLENKKND